VDGAPVQFQIVGVQVEAVHRVGVIGPADAELVHPEVAADEIAHEQGGRLGDQILQLEALRLHPVSAHRSKNQLLVWPRPVKTGTPLFPPRTERKQLLSSPGRGTHVPRPRRLGVSVQLTKGTATLSMTNLL